LHRPDLAGALLHCHAREIICFDSALLERGLRINVLMPQLAIVAGTTRTENFGQAIAECFVGGANLVFRRGEGIWTAGNSAAKAADDAVRLTRDATSKHFALKDAETAV
jgi:biotin synthase-like enzyme